MATERRWRGGPLVLQVLGKDEVLLEFEFKPNPDRPSAIRGKFDLAGVTEIRVSVAQDDTDSEKEEEGGD